MSACDIIQWIRVRLSIGLNASDEVVNKFYNENGNSEEEYWNSSLKDLHNKTTIYYVIPDEGLFHYGQNDNLWNIHRNTHEVIQIMVFYNPVGEESQSDDYFHCSILRSALPSVGSLSESQLDDFLIPEYPDENNCVIEWGIKLGIILSTESEREFNTNQDCVSIALQEYTYWTNRCEKLLPYRELFASDKYQKILSLWESHSDKRWPTLYASLITAAAEAERKYADSSLIVNPLTVVTNILPQKVGLDPLWNICAPLHVSLAITTLCSRHDCERGDLERVYMKSIEDILLKCREYLDPSTLFVVQDFEKQPDILKDNNLESENIHIRGSDTSLHTTKPDKLLCVTQSSTKLEKVISLLTQIEDQYKQLSSCDLLVQNTNWPVNTRRVFSSLSLLKERSEDAQGILKDLSNSQPSIIEDVSGYIRFREIVKVIEGLQFDFCDAGHTANFKIFLKDWKYAISSKPGEPLPATRCLLKRIVTPSADEQYPMSTLLSSFTAASNKVSDNCFIRSREGLSEKEIIVLLEQEKEVLCQKLFEANQTIDENRKAITSLTSENQRIQLTPTTLLTNASMIRHHPVRILGGRVANEQAATDYSDTEWNNLVSVKKKLNEKIESKKGNKVIKQRPKNTSTSSDELIVNSVPDVNVAVRVILPPIGSQNNEISDEVNAVSSNSKSFFCWLQERQIANIVKEEHEERSEITVIHQDLHEIYWQVRWSHIRVSGLECFSRMKIISTEHWTHRSMQNKILRSNTLMEFVFSMKKSLLSRYYKCLSDIRIESLRKRVAESLTNFMSAGLSETFRKRYYYLWKEYLTWNIKMRFDQQKFYLLEYQRRSLLQIEQQKLLKKFTVMYHHIDLTVWVQTRQWACLPLDEIVSRTIIEKESNFLAIEEYERSAVHISYLQCYSILTKKNMQGITACAFLSRSEFVVQLRHYSLWRRWSVRTVHIRKLVSVSLNLLNKSIVILLRRVWLKFKKFFLRNVTHDFLNRDRNCVLLGNCFSSWCRYLQHRNVQRNYYGNLVNSTTYSIHKRYFRMLCKFMYKKKQLKALRSMTANLRSTNKTIWMRLYYNTLRMNSLLSNIEVKTSSTVLMRSWGKLLRYCSRNEKQRRNAKLMQRLKIASIGELRRRYLKKWDRWLLWRQRHESISCQLLKNNNHDLINYYFAKLYQRRMMQTTRSSQNEILQIIKTSAKFVLTYKYNTKLLLYSLDMRKKRMTACDKNQNSVDLNNKNNSIFMRKIFLKFTSLRVEGKVRKMNISDASFLEKNSKKKLLARYYRLFCKKYCFGDCGIQKRIEKNLKLNEKCCKQHIEFRFKIWIRYCRRIRRFPEMKIAAECLDSVNSTRLLNNYFKSFLSWHANAKVRLSNNLSSRNLFIIIMKFYSRLKRFSDFCLTRETQKDQSAIMCLMYNTNTTRRYWNKLRQATRF